MTRAKPLRHTATQPTAFDTATMDLHASRSSRTYAMPERSDHLDFYIRDQTSRPAITDAHKHEYFQIQINLGGDTQQYIGEVVRPFPRGAVALILPHRVHRIPHPEESRFIVVNFSFEFLLGRRLPVEEEAGAIRNEPVFAPFLLQERMDFMLSEPQIAEVESLTAHMLVLDRQRQFGDTILLRA
ncbi:AraC family transcriptional regulator, partial [Paraburkholderia xenovorans]